MKLIECKVYPNGELDNDVYHGEEYADYVSGSNLSVIHEHCPAQLKYGEHKETKALVFGISAHACMLEPSVFAKEFVRGINPAEHDGLLTSDAAIKAKLKEFGVKGYSNKSGSDLLEMLYRADPSIDTLKMLEACHAADNADKTIVPWADHDQVQQMRNVVHSDPEISSMLEGAAVETSIIATVEINSQQYKVKVRPDIITKSCEVPDYKTTINASPEAFGRQAYNAGYWLKQAFIHDVMQAAYGHSFKMGLLAQNKSAPYIHQLYWMTEQQLEVGRQQYTAALEYHKWCNDNNVWPSYCDGAMELPTPAFAANKHGME